MDYAFCDVVCSIIFGPFLLVTTLFFVVVHFAITTFIDIISFVLVGTLFFTPDYLVELFLDMSDLVAAMTFWYVLETYFSNSPSIFARNYRKLCRYPCIGILHKVVFHLTLNMILI